MDRKQKSSNNLGSASSVMSNTSGTVGSVRSGKSSKPPTRGNFSYDTKPDATASNATSTMVTKIETLFRIKHKCVLSGAFDRLIPLSVYAKSPELRASLDKVMPGILSGERNAIGGLSTNNESSLKEIENEEILGGELTELADDVGVDMKSSLDVHTQKALDERAAKSVIRLSNAIMPLLDFYNSSMDTTVLAPKASTTPTKNKIKIGTARNNAASNALGLPSVTVVQEVHHAFHAVLKQIHRLETSTTTAVTSDTEVLHDTAKTTTSSLPPPPPPLVDVMMQVLFDYFILLLFAN